MGLDQYAYARPPRKRNSDNDESLCEGEKQPTTRIHGKSWESKVVQTEKLMMMERLSKTLIVSSCN